MAYGKRRWRRVNFLADQFAARWREDYIQSLQVRRKWRRPQRNIEVGDVVVVKKECKRNLWPLGLIVGTKLSRDGIVRTATIKMKPSESGGERIVERAVHDLVVVTPASVLEPEEH